MAKVLIYSQQSLTTPGKASSVEQELFTQYMTCRGLYTHCSSRSHEVAAWEERVKFCQQVTEAPPMPATSDG